MDNVFGVVVLGVVERGREREREREKREQKALKKQLHFFASFSIQRFTSPISTSGWQNLEKFFDVTFKSWHIISMMTNHLILVFLSEHLASHLVLNYVKLSYAPKYLK